MKRSLAAVLSLGLLLAACDQPASPSATKNPVPEAYRDTTGAAWSYKGPASALPLGITADSPLFSSSLSASSSWGPIELNTSNGEKSAGDGHPITMNGVVYPYGLGLHAGAEISYSSTQPTGVRCELTAEVGVDDEVGDKGSVSFQVYADGNKLYDSGRLTGADGAKHLAATIPSAKSIRLVVTNGGDDYYYDHADIANPSIICTPVTTGTIHHLVYKSSDNYGALYTINSDGSNNMQLSPPISLNNPRFSPDGTKILGSDYAGIDTLGTLYTVNADGSGKKAVAPTTADAKLEADWSPDGKKIVYTQGNARCAGCPLSPSQIWTVNADGSNATQITYQEKSFRPRWSPDGNSILYYTDFDFHYLHYNVMDPDGSNKRPAGLEYYAYLPTWSADGKNLYYLKGRPDISGYLDIIKSAADGTHPIKINTFDGKRSQIAVSNDGKKIGVIGTDAGYENPGVYIMNPDGSDPVLVPGTARAVQFDFQN